MGATVTVQAGKTFVPNEKLTIPKLNLLGLPTILVELELGQVEDVSATPPSDGQILVFNAATGEWTPQAIPVSTSDTFNRIFAWANFA